MGCQAASLVGDVKYACAIAIRFNQADAADTHIHTHIRTINNSTQPQANKPPSPRDQYNNYYYYYYIVFQIQSLVVNTNKRVGAAVSSLYDNERQVNGDSLMSDSSMTTNDSS